MKKVYVKTRMKGIPEGCRKCSPFYTHYAWGKKFQIGLCKAKGWPRFMPENVAVSKERPKWCPLIEISDGTNGGE